MSNNKQGILFRSAGRGYNKDDVNNYIQDKSRAFSQREAELIKYIQELEKKQAEADSRVSQACSVCHNDPQLEEEIDRLTIENADLVSKADCLTKEVATLTIKLEEAIKSAEEKKPTEGESLDLLSARLGDILVKASVQADEIVKEAEKKAEEIKANADKEAETIILDAKVEARITAAKAKQNIEQATAECLNNLRSLTSQAVDSYRSVADETAGELIDAANKNFIAN